MSKFHEVVHPRFKLDPDKVLIQKSINMFTFQTNSENIYNIFYEFDNKHKLPYIISYGKVHNFVNRNLYTDIEIDISGTVTHQTVFNVYDTFDIQLPESTIIKGSIFKEIFHTKNINVDDDVVFVFTCDLEILDQEQQKLHFKFMNIHKFDMKVSRKFLKLYKLLRFKRLAEFIRHPDNIDFGRFIEM